MKNASTSSEKGAPIQVQRDMRILDILLLSSQAADIMAEYGLHCFSCSMGGMESLEDGCRMHDFTDEVIDALVEDLNDMLKEQPLRPPEITITDPAAEALLEIAKAEGHEGDFLIVTVDQHGGFCMEFTKEKADDDFEFRNSSVPELHVLVSPFTLFRIGGATIDYREDRFKLDLPEGGCCGGNQDECGCHP